MLGLLLTFPLACTRVDVAPSVAKLKELLPVCEASSVPSRAGLQLVSLDRPPNQEPRSRVELGPDSLWLNGHQFPALAEELKRIREFDEKIVEQSALEAVSPLELAVDRKTPMTRVVQVVQAAQGARYTELELVASTPQRLSQPEPADAEAYARFLAQVDGLGHLDRAAALSYEIVRLAGSCEEVLDAFSAVAHAEYAPTECTLLIAHLEDALESCPSLPREELLSVVQLSMEPGTFTTTWTLSLDPDSGPLAVEPDSSWEALVPTLLEREGEPTWFELASPEPSAEPAN